MSLFRDVSAESVVEVLDATTAHGGPAFDVFWQGEKLFITSISPGFANHPAVRKFVYELIDWATEGGVWQVDSFATGRTCGNTWVLALIPRERLMDGREPWGWEQRSDAEILVCEKVKDLVAKHEPQWRAENEAITDAARTEHERRLRRGPSTN